MPKDGRISTDFTHSRRMKLGNAPLQDRGEDGGSYKVADEVPSNREPTFEENNYVHPGAAWHATPLSEHASTLMHDSRDVSSDVRPKSSDMSWSHQPKDPHTQWENNFDYLSDTRDVAKWQSSEDPIVKRQLIGILDSELETRRFPQTSSEELSLFYKDPQGRVQCPFKGIAIIGWFEAGYFEPIPTASSSIPCRKGASRMLYRSSNCSTSQVASIHDTNHCQAYSHLAQPQPSIRRASAPQTLSVTQNKAAGGKTRVAKIKHAVEIPCNQSDISAIEYYMNISNGSQSVYHRWCTNLLTHHRRHQEKQVAARMSYKTTAPPVVHKL
ncbi:GYF-like domain superfamily [Sesbania bispinosa]|nr:GYF-like domain superfamily [Sesbania bispinosa]